MVDTTGTEGVPFLDLSRRVAAIQEEVRANLARVLSGGRYILGPQLEAFEERFAAYCGVAHGVGVANGTDAIWLALEALGVGAGDEVITVANTCVPTVSAILEAGATPVLVDVEPGTMTMDPAAAAAAVGPRTRAVVPVHLYGQCADVDALRAAVGEIPIVEDCAQAHGATLAGRRAGSLGVLACFSFYPTKNLGALGDAGMVVTGDPELAERLRLLRNYGYAEVNRAVRLGYNSRLDEVQAAVLLAGLDRLDDWNTARRALARTYLERLAGTGLELPVEAAGREHVYHLFVVRSAERDGLARRLAQRGVGTMVHYPIPIHRQDGISNRCRVGPGGLTGCEAACREVLSLPLYPELTAAEAARVVAAVREAA